VGTRIINNYIRQNAYQGVWGVSDSSGAVRGSYGIEGPQGTMLIAGNVVGGERNVLHVATPGQGTPVNGNHFYGPAGWGKAVQGEPGSLGFGTFIESGNTWDQNLANMPAPPTTLGTPVGDGGPVGGGGIGGGGGGGGGVGGSGAAGPDGIASLLSIFIKDSTRVVLNWTDSYTNEDGFQVERSLDAATWKLIHDTKAPNIMSYEDTGLPAGTVIYYRVTAYKGTGLSQHSNVAYGKTKGVPAGSGTGGGTAGGGFAAGGGNRSFSFNGGTAGPAPVLDPLGGLDPQNRGLFSDQFL